MLDSELPPTPPYGHPSQEGTSLNSWEGCHEVAGWVSKKRLCPSANQGTLTAPDSAGSMTRLPACSSNFSHWALVLNPSSGLSSK